MKKGEKEELLLSFYRAKPNYEELAREIRRLLQTDPSFPTGSLYSIEHRIKDEDRLIEKIDKRNKEKRKDHSPIDATNYKQRIEDLLGIRIVCLRLSDVEKVEEYLQSLHDEGRLAFVRRPQKKRTFILPVDPAELLPKGVDLQYSGYSSIHYLVKLGKSLKLPREIAALRAEIQLRTILEEAWGEIEHKYRYEIIRKGGKLPAHVERGFYNLSAYLQAAALQVEYLCRDAEAIKTPKKRPPKKLEREAPPPTAPPAPSTIEGVLEAKFGFCPTPRTVTYIERRMSEHWIFKDTAQILYEQVLTEEATNAFKEIYKDVLENDPFADETERDLDLLNAVNYGLFRSVQPEAVANEGLESVLRGRR